jgi:opacity protein-like surface antigen
VFAFDYKFRHDIALGVETEFEYGGTGAAMELEYAEAGEYETEVEKGGEVALEQLHITKSFGKAFNVRAGHVIVPVGLTNAHHEPIFYFGTARPEGEAAILPCTWHETGIAVLGYFSGIRLGYEVMIVNGLDPNGFSRAGWVSSGRQKMFEQSVMTSPAFAGRIEYTPVRKLRIGASGYFNRSSRNSTKPQNMAGTNGDVAIASGDAQYAGNNLAARACIIYGTLSDAEKISNINRTSFKKTGYPCTPVAPAAMACGAEAGYNVLAPFSSFKTKLFLFVRYEYYKTFQDTDGSQQKEPRYRRSLFTAGLNYRLLPNVAVKADYSMRRIDGGNYNGENTFGLSVAYTGWFVKK